MVWATFINSRCYDALKKVGRPCHACEFDAGGDEFYQGHFDPLKAGRGHATPIEPVQTAKCSWLLIITLEPSL